MTRKNNVRSHRGLIRLLVLLFLFICAGVLGFYVFAVRNVYVDGNARFTAAQVVEQAGIGRGQSIFLVDENGVADKLASNPYLELVSLKTELPDTVHLTVRERTVEAVVENTGKYIMLDERGCVLAVEDTLAVDTLPLIHGITVTSQTVGQPLGSDDAYKMRVVTSTLQALKAYGFQGQISEIDVTNPVMTQVMLRQGYMVVLGDDTDMELKMKKLSATIQELEGMGQTGGTLDITGESPIFTGSGAQPAYGDTADDDGDAPEPTDDTDYSEPDSGETPEPSDDPPEHTDDFTG